MEMTLYMAELRLAELREHAARQRLVRAARSAQPSVRVMLGHAFIRLGHQLLAGFTAPQRTSRTIGAQKEAC